MVGFSIKSKIDTIFTYLQQCSSVTVIIVHIIVNFVPVDREVTSQSYSIRSLTGYLDWAFCQPQNTGGAFCPPPPPNLAISGQMTMKLSKVILWVEIFTN